LTESHFVIGSDHRFCRDFFSVHERSIAASDIFNPQKTLFVGELGMVSTHQTVFLDPDLTHVSFTNEEFLSVTDLVRFVMQRSG
jgi:hypothetical protein